MIRPSSFLLALLCVYVTVANATEDVAKVARYRVTFDSATTVNIDGAKHSSGNKIDIEYTRERRGNAIEVRCHSMIVTSTVDDKQTYKGHMTREKITASQNGKTQELPARDDPQVKEILEDSFGKPLVTIEVDEKEQEIKRTVSTAPGAKMLIDSGAITSCTLFHAAPGQAKQPINWNLPTGGSATGELVYSSTATPDVVQVKGSVVADKLLGPKKEIMGEKFQITLEGTQQYDAATKDWVSGKLKGPLSFIMHMPKEDVAVAGEITMTLERLAK